MIQHSPDVLEPVNGGIYFKLFTPIYTSDNFKYIYKIKWKYEHFSSNLYKESDIYKLPPRLNGECIVNVSSFLKTLLYPNVNHTQTYVGNTEKSLIDYIVDFGYEHDILYEAEPFNFLGNLGLSFNSAHPFQIDDIIYIKNIINNQNINYTGYATVVSVTPYTIITSKPYGINIPNEKVKITSLMRFTTQTTRLFAYNGTRQYEENELDFSKIHNWTSSNLNEKKILSRYFEYTNKPKLIRENEYETFNLIVENPSIFWLINFEGYDMYNSIVFNSLILSYGLDTNNFRFLTVGVGTQNIIDYLGNANFFWNVDTYEFSLWYHSSPGNIYRYKIDRKCTVYNPVRICFLNRWGGYEYFTFKLDSKTSLNVNRKSFTKPLKYDYNIGDRGESVFNVDAYETIVINSDWVSEDIAMWLTEILTSPDVYIIDGNKKIPVMVLDNNFTYKKTIRDFLINVSISLKYSKNIVIQNG